MWQAAGRREDMVLAGLLAIRQRRSRGMQVPVHVAMVVAESVLCPCCASVRADQHGEDSHLHQQDRKRYAQRDTELRYEYSAVIRKPGSSSIPYVAP